MNLTPKSPYPMLRLNQIAWVLMAGMLGACAGRVNDPQVLEEVWQETVVDIMGLPPTEVRRFPSLATLRSEPTPAVVYLHGCGPGRGNTAHSHIRFFKLQGFAVFAPDHFTRDYARTLCDQDTATTFQGYDQRLMRIAEAAKTREELRKVAWIDQERVYLVGHSEGGWAAGGYSKAGDFAGIINIAGTCVALVHHTPILTITARNDQFANNNSNAPCYRHSAANVTNVVVEGGDHNFIMDTASLAKPERIARDAILGFLHLPEMK